VQRYAFKVYYDGTKPFYGFQRQPNVSTVEGELIRALIRTRAVAPDLYAAKFSSAGRTDRFVSALGNVFAINTGGNLLPRVINSKLRSDGISVWARAQVPVSFNPRQALKRHYRYFMRVDDGIDLRLIVQVSKLFMGVHDFRNFAHRPSGSSSVREITDVSISRLNDNFACISIIGDAFLRKMIRKIIGTLIHVSLGLLRPENVEKLFDPKNPLPKRGVPTVPPEGLVLWDVDYGFPFEVDNYALRKLRRSITEGMTVLVAKKMILDALEGLRE
jgi:tRNA pseudouridine38-40 synthase